MAARSRGLGISRSDMEASRLVFVFVKDSKPRRKVAVPVPESYTWQQFQDQVQTKLKLTGVKEIFLAASGQKVTSLSELQDIDELCVVEAPAGAAQYANGAGAHMDAARGTQPSTSEIVPQPLEISPSQNGTSIHRQQSLFHSAASSHSLAPAVSSSSYQPDEAEHKYAKRANPLKRSLQRMFPSLFAPGLPVTLREAASEGGTSNRRKRSRRGGSYTTRNLLLVLAIMTCVAFMLFFFLRMTPPAAAPTPTTNPA